MNTITRRALAMGLFGFFLIVTSLPACGNPATGPTTQPATRPAARAQVNRPLKDAIRKGDIDGVRKLIEQGVDVNAGADSPLTTAVGFENVEIARLLIDNGAKVDSTNHWGCTALLCAVWGEKPEMVKLLLDRGASSDRDQALDIAASHNDLEFMKLLIAAGADPNASDINGETPLHVVAMRKRGTVAAAKLLIEAGARVDAKDSSGDTPRDLATKYKRQDIVELLYRAREKSEH